MRKKWNIWLEVVCAAGLLVCTSGVAVARGLQYGQGGQSQPPAQQADKPKTPEVTPLTLDSPPPVSAEEDAAYKAFAAVIQNDADKKIELGEAFILKYPETRYRSSVYGALTFAYVQVGNMQKMQEVGEKEIALTPNDVSTLSLMGQTLPRSWKSSAPDAMQVLAMAHSGLGLVFVRRGKNAEAIPELEQAVKIDPSPDPVNYYLLGMANKATSHFDDAVTAFNKCATMTGPMQGICKTQAEDAKKAGATQLSAPK